MGKDYCTLFPESWHGKDIADCCKGHDNDCGEAGSMNFTAHQKRFYNCLRSKGVSVKWAVIITSGGSIGCAIKWPLFVYQKIKAKR